MKIALIAPPFGQAGGPEVVVQNLAKAFSKMKVDFTLFAPADWVMPYPFIPTIPQSLWNMSGFSEQSESTRRNYIIESQAKVLNYQKDFSLIHLHAQRHAAVIGLAAKIPCLVTLHSSIDPEKFYQLQKSGLTLVGLTHSQIGDLPVEAFIRNGIPTEDIAPSFKEGEYLLAVGRLISQKGIHQAIQIAKKAGRPLIIIGRIGVGEERKEYFKKEIEPHIDGRMVRLIESVPHEEIYEYFRKASFFVFPITAMESNPLVVMEALASGTPILGTVMDPLPEMFPESKGVAFFSDNLDELAEAANHPERFDRVACRRYAEEHFDSGRMANEYVVLYQKILTSRFPTKNSSVL